MLTIWRRMFISIPISPRMIVIHSIAHQECDNQIFRHPRCSIYRDQHFSSFQYQHLDRQVWISVLSNNSSNCRRRLPLLGRTGEFRNIKNQCQEGYLFTNCLLFVSQSKCVPTPATTSRAAAMADGDIRFWVAQVNLVNYKYNILDIFCTDCWLFFSQAT